MKCGECEYIRPPCGSGWPYDGERCGRTGVVVRSSDAQCELMILRARVRELEAERDQYKKERDSIAVLRTNLMLWAVAKWDDEVAHRPIENVHRRTLDVTWRQVYRYATGGDELPRPTHDESLSALSAPQAQEKEG